MKGATNFQVQEVLTVLESKALESKFWKRVFKDLKKSSRQRKEVNIYKIDKYAKEGETLFIPGKVLSVGNLTKKVDVAAVNFSKEAEKKIKQAEGKVLTIKELIESNPEGKNVRILG
jgi:large subunit ribosomal protein L18e